ncbi:MAG: FAD-dependent oxidoreductase, partial [Myxococcota bacterium]
RNAALEGEGSSLETIVLADGTRLAGRGLFGRGKQRPVALIEQLGVEVRDGFVVVDEQQRTSLPNLWAAGDCTTYYQQVLEAAAQGGRAAALINAALTIGA